MATRGYEMSNNPQDRSESGTAPFINKSSNASPSKEQEFDQQVKSQQNESASKYTWGCLFILLLISMGNQWQRYLISYANGIGTKLNDPKIEIVTFYPQLANQGTYGLLAGAGFTIAFAHFGIFGGYFSDKFSRKRIIVFAGIMWSVCTLLTGAVNSFALLFVFRILLGVFESAFNPCAYSLIADMFHPSQRTTASAIFNLGIYFGGALASLGAFLIKLIGWRSSYKLIGAIGIGFGMLGLIVPDPERGRFEKKKGDELSTLKTVQKTPLQKFKAAASELFVVPACRWSTIGGCFRFFGGYSIAFFMPKYFGAVYPDVTDPETQEVTKYTDYYFALNAIIVSLMGFCSAFGGGLISDKFEKKGILMTKAYVCLFAGIAGIPTAAVCLLVNNNFWISITFLGLEYLVAECWFAPAIAIVLNTISPENKGFAISAFIYLSTMSGTLGTWLCGFLSNKYIEMVPSSTDPEKLIATNPDDYGKILCLLIVISYGGSLPFFWMAGKEYTAHKKKEKLKEEQASQGF